MNMLSRPMLSCEPTHFINRELALLQFQRRVLAQAADAAMPLLERLKFLCIVSSNLDEFFEIRVSGIKELVRQGSRDKSIDGSTPHEQLRTINQEVHNIIEEQYRLLNQDILPGLAREGIVFLRRTLWTEAQREWISDYFLREVMPVLTPVGLDPAHPFPRVLNKSLNFAVELEGKDAFGRESPAAIVQAPRVLPHVIRLPQALSTEAEYSFVFLSAVLHDNVGSLFEGMQVRGCYQFRVTRNSDLFVDEEEVKDLRATLKGELQQRHFGDAVRLEVADNCSEEMTDYLRQHFELTSSEIYRVPGIVTLVRLMQVPDWVDRPDLKFDSFVPVLPKALSKRNHIFEVIRKQDVLLHHPFESFQPVIELIREASHDPDVLAIKMTVYRTGTDSELMERLIRAAQRGKEVTVVVELMARFDEEANIGWANRLEAAGAHVVYGVFGYKTHAKMLMVVRREEGALVRYVHLGTGNYHPRTTRFYTDFGLLTRNPEIGEDVDNVFKQITGLGQAKNHTHLLQAPFSLHSKIMQAIEAETQAAQAGGKGRIIAKMNALLEPEVIEALYRASQAGVRVDLIVRGPCALRPGVPGLSDNIKVKSVVGRFLEHHRIYCFHAQGKDLIYLSSADWMARNFFRRIEVAFPILDSRIKRRIMKEGLNAYLSDNTQAWEMRSNGGYQRKTTRGRVARSAQNTLMQGVAKM